MTGEGMKAAVAIDLASVAAARDVGRVGMLHPDDMIAAVDVMNFAGHAAREIREEIYRGIADLLDRDGAPQRGIVLVPSEDVAEVADPRRRQRLDRTGGNRVDPDPLLAEIGGE